MCVYTSGNIYSILTFRFSLNPKEKKNFQINNCATLLHSKAIAYRDKAMRVVDFPVKKVQVMFTLLQNPKSFFRKTKLKT